MLRYHNCCSIPALLDATPTRFQNIDESYMLYLREVLFNSIYFVILNKPILGCRVHIYLNNSGCWKYLLMLESLQTEKENNMWHGENTVRRILNW